MIRSKITNKMVTVLKTAYPRAVCYADLYRQVLPTATHTDQIDKSGGARLKTLVRSGQAKRVVEGFYCWVPS